MKKIFIILIIICSALIISYSLYISADPLINWPVNLPKSLSATLGEIRGFSLHQGIDIRTNGRTGYPVFAAGAGKISRLISKENGYGNAIFMGHGSNIETVYGHLDSFEEGKYHLNNMARIFKVLYNKNYTDFRFINSNLYYKKDENIAFTGESGAGFPHLHFEIRKNDKCVNPLDYIHIKDTDPPVMDSLYICSEKDNTTISEKKIRVKKRWGSYITDSNLIETEGEKIFFKISCFDKVGAYNHVAIYRISVYFNKEKIYELAFDGLKNSELQYGSLTYDISKSTIKDGVFYVYTLCRKEANNYTGISSSGDGYLKFSEKEKDIKHITILVSDFAGNEENLQFKILQKKSDLPPDKNFTLINKKKNNSIWDKDKNINIYIPEDATCSDVLAGLEDAVSSEITDALCRDFAVLKPDLFSAFSVFPHDVIYKKPITVTVKKPSGIKDEDARHVQIFQFFEGRKPVALKTKYSSGKFKAETYTNGFFALILDKTPPKISLPPTFELCEDREFYRKLRLNTRDNISRINKDSIICIIDGEIYPSTFDDDRKWIEVKLPRNAVSRGVHHIFAKARDEADNEAVFRGLLTFK
ncbi:MAG: M23 family metallopeptidase [Spirochaetota bacterium]